MTSAQLSDTTENSPVFEALKHIAALHPSVTQVFYGVDHRWFYCGESFDSPEFTNKENIALLEQAVDSITEFPAAFSLHQ